MMRWAFVVFLGLMIFSMLMPWLSKLGIGRVPGDIRFTLFGQPICLPFGSTILWTLFALLVAKFV